MIKKLSADINEALRQSQKDRLKVLRTLKSVLKNREIELRKELTEQEAMQILNSEIKKREQALELYLQAGRQELADNEKFEIAIIREYLPEPLSEAELSVEVDKAISETGADSMKEMGPVMKLLKERLGSRADGKSLSSLVRAKLSN
ncbi:MAG: hypothetical protein APR54_03880 [Candidatus Cloacimonas sp. SDB]|nr:MAG: hypothetical protein APR54_03880 [Candidatus Cloacimonas sp. SDB]